MLTFRVCLLHFFSFVRDGSSSNTVIVSPVPVSTVGSGVQTVQVKHHVELESAEDTTRTTFVFDGPDGEVDSDWASAGITVQDVEHTFWFKYEGRSEEMGYPAVKVNLKDEEFLASLYSPNPLKFFRWMDKKINEQIVEPVDVGPGIVVMDRDAWMVRRVWTKREEEEKEWLSQREPIRYKNLDEIAGPWAFIPNWFYRGQGAQLLKEILGGPPEDWKSVSSNVLVKGSQGSAPPLPSPVVWVWGNHAAERFLNVLLWGSAHMKGKRTESQLVFTAAPSSDDPSQFLLTGLSGNTHDLDLREVMLTTGSSHSERESRIKQTIAATLGVDVGPIKLIGLELVDATESKQLGRFTVAVPVIGDEEGVPLPSQQQEQPQIKSLRMGQLTQDIPNLSNLWVPTNERPSDSELDRQRPELTWRVRTGGRSSDSEASTTLQVESWSSTSFLGQERG